MKDLTMDDIKMMKKNFKAIKKLPYVKELKKMNKAYKKDNKRLRKENENLKNVISLLGEIKHNSCSTSCKPVDVISISSDEDIAIDENITYSVIQDNPVIVKKEPGEDRKNIVYTDDGETMIVKQPDWDYAKIKHDINGKHSKYASYSILNVVAKMLSYFICVGDIQSIKSELAKFNLKLDEKKIIEKKIIAINDPTPIRTAGNTHRPRSRNTVTPIANARLRISKDVSSNGPIGKTTIRAIRPPSIA